MTNLTCSSCIQGYYLRTFSGGNKTYNSCWSTAKMIWTVLGAILAGLIFCYMCKFCYEVGKKSATDAEAEKNDKQDSKFSTPRSKEVKDDQGMMSTDRNRP
jgi:hypothetical protein